jgi:hypothetical protein
MRVGSEIPGSIEVRIGPDDQRIVVEAEHNLKIVGIEYLGKAGGDVEIEPAERRSPAVARETPVSQHRRIARSDPLEPVARVVRDDHRDMGHIIKDASDSVVGEFRFGARANGN